MLTAEVLVALACRSLPSSSELAVRQTAAYYFLGSSFLLYSTPRYLKSELNGQSIHLVPMRKQSESPFVADRSSVLEPVVHCESDGEAIAVWQAIAVWLRRRV